MADPAEDFDWDKEAEDFDWGAQEDAPAESVSPFEGAVASGEGAPQVDPVRGALATVLQGTGFNFADEIAGNEAMFRTAQENIGKPRGERIDPMWARRHARDEFRALEEGYREESPTTALALGVGGGLVGPNPVGMLGSLGYRLPKALWSVVGPGARGLSRFIPSAVEGAAAGVGAADELENAGASAALGAALGVGGRALGELGGAALGGAKRLVEGVVRTSPFAQYLRSRGVKDLTIGQMAPDSFPAQMEEIGTSKAGIGPSIVGQRQAGTEGWQQAVMKEAMPPGAGVPNAGAPLSERLADAYDAFESAYAPARGVPIIPEGIGALADAADNPNIIADANMRSKVRDFLENQLTKLRPDPQTGAVASDDILSMRKAVREAIRDSSEPETRRFLQAAADDLTNLLDAQLPPQAANALRAADAAYAKHVVVGNAIGRSGDQIGGFSPAQLSQAVKSNTERRAYERGAGGDLRELARAGKETLEPRIPRTGERLVANLPGMGFAAYAANLPGPKAFLTGQTAAQQSLARNPVFQAATGPGMQEAMGRVGQAGARTMEALRGAGAAQPSEGEMAEMLALENPEALGPYAERLQRASAEGNLALVHWGLQQTDPQYRQLLAEARKAAQ